MKTTEDNSKKYCGAKTRAGTPCRRQDLWPNGRCKLHGGPSTGPKTAKGKARSARNGFPHKKSDKDGKQSGKVPVPEMETLHKPHETITNSPADQ